MKLRKWVKVTLMCLLMLGYIAYAIDYSHKVTQEQWEKQVKEWNY